MSGGKGRGLVLVYIYSLEIILNFVEFRVCFFSFLVRFSRHFWFAFAQERVCEVIRILIKGTLDLHVP